MAEIMRLLHARYRPGDLQVHFAVPSSRGVFDVHPQRGVGGMWNNAFKVISVIPVLGVIVIRIIEVFTVCFAVISAMLGGIFLAVMNCMSNSEHEEGDGTEPAPQQEHFALTQVECASRYVLMRILFIHFTPRSGSCPCSSNHYVG